MEVHKAIEKFQKTIREAEIKDFDDLEKFSKDTSESLMDIIGFDGLGSEELIVLDHLLRSARAAQGGQYKRLKLQENSSMYDREFSGIQRALEKIAGPGWLVYRDFPPVETMSNGRVVLVYNKEIPDSAWHYYIDLGLLKSADSKIEQASVPDKLIGFVRALLLYDFPTALKRLKVAKK